MGKIALKNLLPAFELFCCFMFLRIMVQGVGKLCTQLTVTLDGVAGMLCLPSICTYHFLAVCDVRCDAKLIHAVLPLNPERRLGTASNESHGPLHRLCVGLWYYRSEPNTWFTGQVLFGRSMKSARPPTKLPR